MISSNDIVRGICMRRGQYIIVIIILFSIAFLFIGCPGTDEYMEEFAYVVNHYAHSVSVIDIEKAVSDPQNAVIATVIIPNTGEVIKGIAVSPDKRSIFVPDASYVGESLWIISAEDISEAGFSPSSPIPTGEYSVAVEVTPDGKYAYVLNNYENTVSIVSTETKTVVSTVTVGATPQNIAFSPDGEYAYVTNKGANTVSVIDTERAVSSPFAAIVSTIAITADPPKGIAVTPDGLHAFVATAGGEGFGNQVAVLDLLRKKEVDTDGDDGNGVTHITLYETAEGAPRAVAITPDGKFAYVTNLYTNVDEYSNDTVSVIDTATYGVVDAIIVGDSPKGIAITSNGKYAFVANFNENSVSVIDLSTNIVISTIMHVDIQQPNWVAM